ncbi:hypothetical protein OAK00_02350 [Pelagibacteraceae bacterium]|nr:hypothetical protein [Pelagibacteraceae bacterium]|tara:strand:- start:575 stop:1066 length:492 start_codon:yes stop_codon:yes gene_type:complete
MKKKKQFILPIILLILINACAGYEPIFSSTNLKFKISDYSIQGDKRLGNKIYSKLHSISKSNEKNSEIQSLNFLINAAKEKTAVSKDSSGKIIQYKITLKTEIEILDVNKNKKILDQTFTNSLTYKIQDQYSETINLENKLIQTLVDNTYQELITKISLLLIE